MMTLKIRQYFFTGLLAILPLSLTLFLSYKIFRYIIFLADLFISPNIYVKAYLGGGALIDKLIIFLSYIIAIFSAILIVIFAGLLTLNYFGQFMLKLVEGLIAKVPLARHIYSTIKQISELVLSQEGSPYKHVVLVEYPKKGFKSIGFLTNNSVDFSCSEDLASVFIPTSPNPTSGVLILVKREEIIHLKLNVEQAIKFIISAGAIKPEEIECALPKKSVKDIKKI